MKKLKIAILFGGCSEEHDVSVKSAGEIAAHINLEKYEPYYIGITRSGEWRLCEYPCPEWESQKGSTAFLSPNRKTQGLIVLQGSEYKICPVDAVFPVLHGKTGEDGTIQGLLELSGIPYVGCDIQSSVICMDKSLAYMTVRNAGIATPDFWVGNRDDLREPLPDDYPVFVKPARSGSSFGVTKASSKQELTSALRLAGQYDCKILIERAISGIEAGCAVLGIGSDLFTGEVDQITLSHGFFRIHQEHTPESGSENAHITVPADLPVQKRLEIQETAKNIYRALGCRGLARVDLFIREDGGIVLNEVNTLPGFTSYSRYPRMMAAAGITLTDLIDRLITLARNGD